MNVGYSISSSIFELHRFRFSDWRWPSVGQSENRQRDPLSFSGNILRLSFREYINDMARPSYFQDVTYDIPSFPTEITFKTVKLQVLSAGNNGIRYKILSGF
ncbi:MAG: hypothetical protein ACI83P_001997 [Janthinobacterium sp.]|jgi:hypothetical protein